MITRRPRMVLAFAAALLVAVLALFTVAVLNANNRDRRDAERRFRDKAAVAASLTESIFTSTSAQSAAENARRYGSEKVRAADLDRAVKQSRLSYMVVLDDRGIPLAVSSNTPPEALRHIAGRPGDVKAVLAGDAFALSDFVEDVGPGVMQYSTSFDTPHGRRLLVQGFPAQLIGVFLGGTLAGIPDTQRTEAYVIDSRGRVIGTPVEDQPVGSAVRQRGLVDAVTGGDGLGTFDSAGTERAFAAAGVDNSTWRVVLSTPTSRLYAGINTALEWLILVALGLAGIVVLVLLRRTVLNAVALHSAYARLELSNAELEHSNLELKRSNAELEQFASVASHDLQEPLRKVQTFGDQLERRFGDEIPDEAKDYLRRMRRAAGRMSTLIDDLLRFSRVTTHARPPRPVPLATIAREVTSDLEAVIQETHGSVRIGDLPTVEADALQMRQLLQNLIGNGLKFHRPGIEPVVDVEAAASDEPGTVAFTVTDNGIGFEPQYSERIFRVFERLHPRDVYDGTGIGLALCRKIAERHGGTITGEGRPDEGARFTVTLPLVQPRSLAPVAMPEPAVAETREPAHV